MAVGDFCDEMARLGWQWGERDCLLWLGLWSERMTGVDGGAPWRGRYRTALGCVRTLNRSGGMEACIERGAALAGLVEVDARTLSISPENIPQPFARPGAVGLVEAMTPRGPSLVGSIFTGERWAVLTPGAGVLSIRTTPLRAWNLP